MKWYNPWTWFPFSRDGRQTLLYIVLALCGPALTGCIMRVLSVIETFPDTTGQQRLDAYVELAKPLTWALLIIVIALACFVSIRAVKIGKDGITASSFGDDNAATGAQLATDAATTAGQDVVDALKSSSETDGGDQSRPQG